jgi:beta-lactamase regulating signal transducer with metallopeptidase domain
LNALGLTLLSSIAHATVFALAGTIVYLAIRRLSPAAGALAAGSCLLFMAIVSAVAVGPWPRWCTIAAPRIMALPPAAVSNEALGLRVRPPKQDVPGERPAEAAVRRLESGKRTETAAPSQSPAHAFASEHSHTAWAPSREVQPSRWGWPDWLAIGFFASLLAGLARFGLGLLAVARLRSRSRPLGDVALLEEIDMLRAELACTGRVEVRESSELDTPATLGWRKPLVLLPFDWRDWSRGELRAVLAHELAHVARSDFLTGLIAQFSVALHFYHPLAHWLAKRLRLEQELAADCWGAALSGGSPNYLMTLAQMALKRDDRGLAGPARAFLPSRGTLVTRIEMLRNTQFIQTGVLPARARAAMIGLLGFVGFAVAGLRGPASQAQSNVQAIEGESAQVAGQNGSRANAPSLDLSLLPAETRLFFALQPAALLERDEIRALVRDMRQGALARWPLVIPPEEIEQFACFWEGLPEAPGAPGRSPFIPAPSGVMVRSTKAQDWKSRLADQFAGAQEFRVDGQICYRLTQPPIPGWCAVTFDDRTLVLAMEDTIRDLIQDRRAPAPRRPWDEAWDKSASGQVVAAIDMRWLRRRLTQAAPHSGPDGSSPFGVKLDTIAPLLEKAQAYVISVHASPGILVDVRAVTRGGDGAKPVAETLQAVITLARNSIEGLMQDSAGKPLADAMKNTLGAAGELLAQAKIETSGSVVHLQAKSTMELSDVVKSLAPALKTARATARRMSSVNNLKQIGLAFHNYAAVYNHFPSPALLGGEQKKYPYSWRVALLPFIEQQALYEQYHFDEPWDGPNNRKLIDQMPAIYSVPGPDGNPSSRSTTSYHVFAGDAAALGSPQVAGGKVAEPKIEMITDGTSNTILAVEWEGNIPWTKPVDIPFDPAGAAPAIGGFWPNVFNALMCDGSVRGFRNPLDADTFKALITRAGREVISTDRLAPVQTRPSAAKP